MARAGDRFPDLEERFRVQFFKARTFKRMSQQAVAKKIGVTQQTVARFESHERGLSANDIPRWAAAVGEDWRSLLLGDRAASVEPQAPRSASEAEEWLASWNDEIDSASSYIDLGRVRPKELRRRLDEAEQKARRASAAIRFVESSIAAAPKKETRRASEPRRVREGISPRQRSSRRSAGNRTAESNSAAKQRASDEQALARILEDYNALLRRKGKK